MKSIKNADDDNVVDLDGVTKTAEAMVHDSIIQPSAQFGPLIYEVCHGFLGEKAKHFRNKLKVRAVDVAKELGLTKVQVHFMEIGRKQWTIESLKAYLKAVQLCHNRNSKET